MVAEGVVDSREAGKAIGLTIKIAGASEINATKVVSIASLLYLRLMRAETIIGIMETNPSNGGTSCSRYQAVIFFKPPIRNRMRRITRVVNMRVIGMRRKTRQRRERQVGDSKLSGSKVVGSTVLILF